MNCFLEATPLIQTLKRKSRNTHKSYSSLLKIDLFPLKPFWRTLVSKGSNEGSVPFRSNAVVLGHRKGSAILINSTNWVCRFLQFHLNMAAVKGAQLIIFSHMEEDVRKWVTVVRRTLSLHCLRKRRPSHSARDYGARSASKLKVLCPEDAFYYHYLPWKVYCSWLLSFILITAPPSKAEALHFYFHQNFGV